MDDEHCTFWVDIFNDQNEQFSLQVDKNLKITLALDPENIVPDSFTEKSAIVENWNIVLSAFGKFLNGKMNDVSEMMDRY